MSKMNFIFPNEFKEEILYFETKCEDKATHLGGLFNSLYPHDWTAIIGVYVPVFELSFSGKLEDCEIILHHADGRLERLNNVEKKLTEDGVILRPSLVNTEPGQRLTVRLEHSENFEIHSGGWQGLVDRKPKLVELAIVICTFNNEGLLTRNVERLLKSNFWKLGKASLIIINNGKLDASFKSNLPDRVNLVEQSNLGGAGGFGRGIYEILHGKLGLNASHILLMDDDVVFEPEIIERTIHLYEYSNLNTCIGGSMLKLEIPTYLHEAGSDIRSTKSIGTITKVAKGCISETKALAQLGCGHQHDYNAWWYASFPVSAAKEIGLPLPIFIHGDDIEYGVRLKQYGYNMYCPGGISLWHQCFENKHLTWIRYFDFRNALIRLTYHYNNSSKVLITQLKRICKRATIRNDYGGFIMALKAFEDFCNGPSILNCNDFNAQIASLNDLYKEFSDADSTGRYKFSNKEPRCQQSKKLRRGLKYLTSNLHALPLPSFRHYETENARFSWSNVPYLSDISVKLQSGEIVLYKRDRQKYIVLKNRLNQTLKKYSQNLEGILEEWRSEEKVFHSSEFWRKYTHGTTQ